MARGDLTPKQARFAQEYLIDHNGTRAAIAAGYAAKSASVEGVRLLANAKIALLVAKAETAISERTGLTADRVRIELGRLAFSDIRKLFTSAGSLMPIHLLDDDTAASISSVEVVTRKVPGGDETEVEHVSKIKLWDKRGAISDAARVLGMFIDKSEVTVIDRAGVLAKMRERASGNRA